jgi:glyoxylase-like metal-dependent hydrolase (beta-lactamase superfamily II)
LTESPEAPPSGILESVAPRLRRLVAPNASAFTQTGTCTYIVGEGEVAILDPGPDDEAHLQRLLAAVRGERISHIVVTHTHRDHSALVNRLAAATGAEVVGARPHFPRPGAPQGLDAAHDLTYAPSRVLAEGEALSFGDETLVALATPGHAANHLCFVWGDMLFSGDHVMAWSTSVVAPPDGVMADYMASLEKLREREETIYWPGHGGPVRDPKRYVRGLITHRRQRETSILTRLDAGPATIAEIVEKNYAGLAPRLKGAAALSTLAHMEDLLARGLAVRGDGAPLEAVYARA